MYVYKHTYRVLKHSFYKNEILWLFILIFLSQYLMKISSSNQYNIKVYFSTVVQQSMVCLYALIFANNFPYDYVFFLFTLKTVL